MRWLLGILFSLSVSSTCWAGASRSFASGSSQRINAGTGAILGNQSNWTSCAWVNASTKNTSTRTIVGKRDSFTVGGNEFHWGINPSDSSPGNLLTLDVNNTFVNIPTSTVTMSIWQFLCITANSSTATGYINNVSVGTNSADWRSASCGGCTIGIGGEITEAAEYFNGSIAYLHVYNRVLTTDEMGQIMRYPGSIANGLKAFWPLYENAGTEYDLSGNANTGTVTGATLNTDGPPVLFSTPLSWMREFWGWLDHLLVPNVLAADVIQCSAGGLVTGSVVSYQQSVDTTPFLGLPNTLIHSSKSVSTWDGIVPDGSRRYWKCLGSSVVTMTVSEQTTLDAPLVVEQARQATFSTEVSTNDLCTAELSDLDARIDAGVNAITDLASAKVFLRVALKKVARCLRARAR